MDKQEEMDINNYRLSIEVDESNDTIFMNRNKPITVSVYMEIA